MVNPFQVMLGGTFPFKQPLKMSSASRGTLQSKHERPEPYRSCLLTSARGVGETGGWVEGRRGRGFGGGGYRSYIRGAFLYPSVVSKWCPALTASRFGSCKEVRAESYLIWHAGWVDGPHFGFHPSESVIMLARFCVRKSAFNIACVPVELWEDVSLMQE